MTVPSEHAEQVTFVRWFRDTFPEVRIFAIPNGGYRSIKTAKDLKAEGASPGVPDLFVPVWGLWIEMKRSKGGRLSPDQKDWKQYLESIGHTVIVGKGHNDAIEQVNNFLEQNGI